MANPTNYYVDPVIAGNSGTGSIGDPFGDLQYALNTVTRDATNGDQFNIKAGTDEVLAAALSLATYGTPTDEAQLLFRGYTATANDGGFGGISGAGAYSMLASAYTYVNFTDMHLHNCGSANIVTSLVTTLNRCEINNTSGSGVYSAHSVVNNCYFHDIGTYGVLGSINTVIAVNNCFFKNGTKTFSSAIQAYAAIGANITHNIISIDGASIGILLSRNTRGFCRNNSIYSSGGTGKGIYLFYDGGVSVYSVALLNNIIEGFSGVGGIGINVEANISLAIYGHNKFYNNTTHESLNGSILTNLGNNDTLLASPFTNPAGDDFSVSTAVKATAYPSSFYGSSTNNYLDPGAAQRQEAGGGPVAGNMRGGFING